MASAAESAKADARRALPCSKAYAAIEVPRDMGCEAHGFKWRQSQTHVEVFVSLPPGTSRRAVHVNLTSVRLEVSVEERPVLQGTLWREVKADESTWYIQVGCHGARCQMLWEGLRDDRGTDTGKVIGWPVACISGASRPARQVGSAFRMAATVPRSPAASDGTVPLRLYHAFMSCPRRTHVLLTSNPQDDILEIVLLKRHRRGNYADGETNATTFWHAVTKNAAPEARLALEHPPTKYYSSHWEGEQAGERGVQPRRRLQDASAGSAQTLVPAC